MSASSARRQQANGKKVLFRERLKRYMAKKRVDPHYWMAACLADDSVVTRRLEDGTVITEPTVPIAIKFQCAKELAQYLEPKLRSVELTGDADNPVRVLQEMPDEQLDAYIRTLLTSTRLESIPIHSEAESEEARE